MTPCESVINKFCGLTPKNKNNLAHAMAAAPAPLNTTFTLSIFLLATSSALMKAALAIIAVPSSEHHYCLID